MLINPYFEVIIASLIWGSAGIFVKLINLPATTMSFFRVTVPTLVLLIYFIYRGKNLFSTANKMAIFLSLITSARIFLWLFGFMHTSIGNGIIILYTWPIFTVVFSALLLKERITKQKLLLLLVAFVGIIIVFADKEFSFTNKDFIGMSAMLVSAMLSAFSTILFKKQLIRYSKLEMIFYQNFLGVFIFLPFIFINTPLPTISQIFISSVYSVIIGICAFLLWFSALKKIKASTAALLSYVEVIGAIILGVLILNESITWNMLIGGVIILTVSYFARKTEPELVVE